MKYLAKVPNRLLGVVLFAILALQTGQLPQEQTAFPDREALLPSASDAVESAKSQPCFTLLAPLTTLAWNDRGGQTQAASDTDAAKANEPDRPTSRTRRCLEGWTILVDDRLLQAPHDELGRRALRFLEAKLADIKAVVPKDRLEKLQAVRIVLDLNHGKLRAMQYHPSVGWLKANGYSPELAKCVHLPRAADVATPRNIREQPWVILHELAHAYHDQVLGFEEPRILEAYQKYKKSGRGDKTLHCSGRRVRHYALTNQMEFFAEMTESYFGVNDFFPFNRAELKESEPEIYELMHTIWEAITPPASKQDGNLAPQSEKMTRCQ
jgi:hypothetical protein